MRGAVHEGLPAHDRPTPITRGSLPSVGMEGVGKIARLTVDIDVLAVKTRATFLEGFVQNSPHLSEENSNLGCAQAPRGSEVVGFAPQSASSA